MSSSFDVFLVYNRDDIPIVQQLAHALVERGIRAWIADYDIQPGTVRQAALEHAIETARAAAVLVGRDGIGPWEQQQMRAVLDRFVEGNLPVIPVLLPLAPREPDLPRFLKAFTWVDLRQGLNAEGLARLAWGITGERSLAASGDRQPMISISQLPSPGQHFVSREAELGRMARAWQERHVNVLSIVAPGGVGKSALVSRWLIAPESLGAERVFCWSFYREVASVDRFLDAALRWFGDPEPAAGSAWDQGRRLAELVRQRRTILVLDGLEAQQHPPGSKLGQLKDEALKVLIKELAAFNRGLCIVTTRQPIFEISHFKDASAWEIELPALTREAGARLLHDLGVEGEESDLRLASAELDGHALTLCLLGSYLVQAYRGQIRYRDQVQLVEADRHFGGQARQVMKAYEAWLERRELAVLRLIAFFDRPTEAPAIKPLITGPVIPGLTEELASMDGRDWRVAGENLRRCGLLYPRPGDCRDDMALDTSPLVRAYFRDRLQHRQQAAWVDGNLRLYRHFQDSVPDLPATLDDMIPLYRAVVHGCRAGEQQEALTEVYYRRIMRRDKHFSWKNLGCLGTELATLASFFEIPWDRPSSRLSPSEQGFVLSATGMCLRTLGRLSEAAQPIRASLELARELKHWDSAGLRSNNLCDLYLIRGELDRALASIEESIELADRGRVPFLKAGTRLTRAHTLHQMGRWQDSLRAFQAADEIIQTEALLRQDALLFLHKAFHYCDYLLGRAEVDLWPVVDSTADPASGRRTCRQAKEYAEQALATAEDRGWDREIALSHMFLGRAHLDLELLATRDQRGHGFDAADSRFEYALRHLDQAVERLRQGEQQTYVPRALLARAALYRVLADDRAFSDLTEAEKLASSHRLPLHSCDIHLEWARLHADRRELELACERIVLARELAAAKGYHCRDQEIAAVKEIVL